MRDQAAESRAPRRAKAAGRWKPRAPARGRRRWQGLRPDLACGPAARPRATLAAKAPRRPRPHRRSPGRENRRCAVGKAGAGPPHKGPSRSRDNSRASSRSQARPDKAPSRKTARTERGSPPPGLNSDARDSVRAGSAIPDSAVRIHALLLRRNARDGWGRELSARLVAGVAAPRDVHEKAREISQGINIARLRRLAAQIR